MQSAVIVAQPVAIRGVVLLVRMRQQPRAMPILAADKSEHLRELRASCSAREPAQQRGRRCRIVRVAGSSEPECYAVPHAHGLGVSVQQIGSQFVDRLRLQA